MITRILLVLAVESPLIIVFAGVFILEWERRREQRAREAMSYARQDSAYTPLSGPVGPAPWGPCGPAGCV